MTASLLKRVAEAADGYRSGNEIWIVAATKFPHELEVFKIDTEAQEYKKQKSRTHEIFGPFMTGSPTAMSSSRSQIKEIVVTLKTGKKINIDPNECDSLFWSESAFDKFVFPYYSQLYGVEHAAKMRKETVANSEAVIFGHTDGTRWLPRA